MNPSSTWLPPVAVSLLLHAALIMLFTYRLSLTGQDKVRSQAITVEMLGVTAAPENRPRIQKPAPVVTNQPVQEPVKTDLATLPNPAANPATALPEQNSTQQADSNASDFTQSSLNIQPLSKLTKPPTFLRKIEPVYPVTEQRAGSQAYVLAEVTIDDKGNVVEVKILKSAGNAFDAAVTEALKKSIFMPGYIGREAVAVRVLVPFRFNLR